ncbi:unknown protein [Microcystis aeruginosa NIES-843]|uniref:Uncharacterized protein n=1 Tax=Microcystis aeruginosa (strain NIES-843 / IAM M-2473) TaxID=449447 RepID=B0JIN9_MICAN|nr:unknown protein [Microcystis aeruginosa NIES-843]
MGGLRCYFWGLSTKAARKPKKCRSTARKSPTVLSRKNVKLRPGQFCRQTALAR